MRLAVILILIAACNREPQAHIRKGWDCAPMDVDARASFTLKCLENANPKSDEEPEDWMRICGDLAQETYCEEVSGVSYWDGDFWSGWKPCRLASNSVERSACAKVGELEKEKG